MAKQRLIVGIGAVFLAASVLPAGSARGSAGTVCVFEVDVIASPGLTTSPSSGNVTTNGETGTMTCDGPVNGKQPSGPGTVGFDGRYGTQRPFACQDDGHGAGVLRFTIPVSGGAEHVASNTTYAHGGYKDGQFLGGTFEGDRMSGTFAARPVEGDCVSKPMTKIHLKAKGTLR